MSGQTSLVSVGQLLDFFEKAVVAAELFRGQTSPNPPVGAVAWDDAGNWIETAAHERAGEDHAEAALIRKIQSLGRLNDVRGVLVTLEPCNHFGRTPPCSESLITSFPHLKEVFFAERDPNPHVRGGGKSTLEAAGVRTVELREVLPERAPIFERGLKLLGPFFKKSLTGRPWITVKTAHLFEPMHDSEFLNPQYLQSSMIPPKGEKTFTSQEALLSAHQLRKRSDLILTGAATAVIDQPLFTVRRVPDFSNKKRQLWVVGRSSPELAGWLRTLEPQSFNPEYRIFETWGEAYQALAREAILEVLVEAGPKLTHSVLSSGHWDEHCIFLNAPTGGATEMRIRTSRSLASL